MLFTKPYVEGVRDPKIRKLFAHALRNLNEEFDQMYKRTDWAEEFLFTYNERVLVGLFNNAVIRDTYDYNTFQEYQVYSAKDQLKGRADLMIIHNNFYLLLEAKKWDYNGGNYSSTEISNLFDEPKKQVQEYYAAEQKFFDKKTYLGVIIFEYVAENCLKTLKEQYRNETEELNTVHFDALYSTDKNGLMVYGNIFLPGNKLI